MLRTIKKAVAFLLVCAMLAGMGVYAVAADTSSNEAVFFDLLSADSEAMRSAVAYGHSSGNWDDAKNVLLQECKSDMSEKNYIVNNTSDTSGAKTIVYDTLTFSESLISVKTVTTQKSLVTFALGSSSVRGDYLLTTFRHAEHSGICMDSKEAGSSTSPQLVVKFTDGTTRTLLPQGDAYVRATGCGSSDAYASTAFGTANPTQLWAMHRADKQNLMPYSSDEMRTYISFDTDSLGGKAIASGELRIYAQVKNPNGGSADSTELPLMLMSPYFKDLEEDTITWSLLKSQNSFGHYSWDGISGGIVYNESLYGTCFGGLGVPNEFANATSRFCEEASLCLTGNYAQAKRQLLRFAEQTYDVIANGTGFPVRRPLEPANRSLEFPYIYRTLLMNNALSAQENYELLRWYYQDIRFLYLERTGRVFTEGSTPNTSTQLYATNWGVWHICGFFNCVQFFDMFKQTAEWKNMFEARLSVISDKLINADGSYLEVTFGYPVAVIGWFINMLSYMTSSGYDETVSAVFANKMIRLTKYLLDCTYPNGILPLYGDGNGGKIRSVINTLLSVPSISSNGSTAMKNLLWYITDGAQGERPDLSVLYKQAKIAVDRTGWGADDAMLFTNAKGGGSHCHADALAILFYAKDRNLLSDVGTITYDSASPAFSMRTRSSAHNTVAVDSVGQRCKGSSVLDGYDGADDNINMAANNSVTTVREYTTSSAAATHYRNITHLKYMDDLLLVSDSLIPKTSGSHTYTQNWHSAVGANPATSASLGSFSDNVWGYTNYSSGANLMVSQARPNTSASSPVIEHSTPSCYDESSPTGQSAYMEFKQTTSGNAAFNTALYPYSGTQEGIRTIKLTTGVYDNTASCMRIQRFNSSTLSTLRDEAVYYNSFEDEPAARTVTRRTDSEGYVNRFTTDAKTAVYHVLLSEKTDMLYISEGKSLTVDRTKTVDGVQDTIELAALSATAPVTDLTAYFDAQTGTIHIDTSDVGILSRTTGVSVRFDQFTGSTVDRVLLNGTELIDGVNVEITSNGATLPTSCLLFDFKNDSDAAKRYSQAAYGGGNYNYDSGCWAVNSYRNSHPVFSSESGGTLTTEIIKSGSYNGFDSGYIQISANQSLGRDAACLDYQITGAEVMQIRLRLTNCAAAGNARIVGLFANAFEGTDFNWKYTAYQSLPFTDGEYLTVTLPITEAIRQLGNITTFRVAYNNLRAVDPDQPSELEIDSIFIGRQVDSPIGLVHTAVFTDSDGIIYEQREVKYTQSYGTLPVPRKSGYTFDGWYTAQTGGAQLNAASTVTSTEDETIYAHWIANEYEITYDNLFNLYEWRNNPNSYRLNTTGNSISVNCGHGELSGTNGTISVTTEASGVSSTVDVRTAFGDGDSYYNMPVSPHTEYVFSCDIAVQRQAQWLIFVLDSSYKLIRSDTVNGSQSFSHSSGVLVSNYPTKSLHESKRFVTTDHAAYIQIRFGNAGFYSQTSVFSNVRITKKGSAPDDVTYPSAGKRYSFGSQDSPLAEPQSSLMHFDGWYTGENGTGQKITDDNYYLISESTVLYSKWLPPVLSSDTLRVDFGGRIISGFAPQSASLDSFLTLSDPTCSIAYQKPFACVGTGTTVTVMRQSEPYESYTAVLYGDLNGDGKCDGQDAVLLSCRLSGALTAQQLGEFCETAADCDHSQSLDDADFQLLIGAGLMEAEIDQTP